MRIFRWVFLIFFVLILSLSLTVYLLLKSSVAPYQSNISLSGLKNDVIITFDAKGIPQIWAQNTNDAMFAMGWQHASERLFQMDLTRRVSQGRLSEILGGITLKIDKESRTIGHNRIAEAQLENLSEVNRAQLQAYSVSQFVTQLTS